MKLLLLENPKVKDSRIRELFGLSNSGKSTYVKNLISGRYNISTASEGGHFKKLALFVKYFCKRPINTCIFYLTLNRNWVKLNHLSNMKYLKIAIMRNSYMTAVLARYEAITRKNKLIYADEFFLQSLFMIYQKKATKSELIKMMNLFPKSRSFVLIEVNQKIRYERLNKNGFPGEKIDRKYAEVWMKNSESNYGLVKEILLEHCKVKSRKSS